MKQRTRSSTLCALAAAFLGAGVASGQVSISQVYGAGGMSATQPNADYVELYNWTTSPVSLNGWSLQVTNSDYLAGWTVIPLSGVIQPNKYFLVQMISPASATGTPLPTPNLVANNSDDQLIQPQGSYVALRYDAIPLPDVFCPVGLDPNLLDYVAWGNLATIFSPLCAEGGSYAPATSGVAPFQAIIRRGAGCMDTNSNAADFEPGPPNPHNSASPANTSVFVTSYTAPAGVNAGGSTTIAATFQSCAVYMPPVTSVTGDFSAFGLGTQSFTFAGPPQTWIYTLNVPVSQGIGTYTIPITGIYGANTYHGTATVEVMASAPTNDLCANPVVLNQGSMPLAFSVDLSGATADVRPGTCTGTQTQGLYGIWYSMSPSVEGTLMFHKTSAQFLYTGVWTNPGDCGALNPADAVCLTGNDWGVHMHPGNTYLIQVGLKASSGAPTPSTPLAGVFSFLSTPPGNDDCVNALDVTGMANGSTILSDMRFAHNDAGVSPCPNPVDPTPSAFVGNEGRWYKFVATQSGSLSSWYEAVTGGSGNGPRWGIWSVPTASGGHCAQILPENAALCSKFGMWSLQTTPGQTYYMLVSNANYASGYVGGTLTAEYPFHFLFTPGLPGNDDCTGALDLSAAQASPLHVLVDNSLANSEDLSLAPCAGTGAVAGSTHGVWFKYAPTIAGTLTITETGSQAVAWTQWSVTSGTGQGAACGSFSGANAESCGRVRYSVAPGRTYYFLAINSAPNSNSPPMIIDASFTSTNLPANDLCSNAVDVANILEATQVVDITNAGDDVRSDCSRSASAHNATRGIWYRYTAPQDGEMFVSETSPVDTWIVAWQNPTCPDESTPQYGSCWQQPGYATGQHLEDYRAFAVHAGQTYYFQLSYYPVQGTPAYPLLITFHLEPGATNDECATAANIAGAGRTYFHNDGATLGTTFNTLPCTYNGRGISQDVWFRWTALESGPAAFQIRTFEYTGYTFPFAYMAIYNSGPGGSCPTGVGDRIFCGPSGTPFPDSSTTTFSPTAGSVYYIQITADAELPSQQVVYGTLEITQQSQAVGRCCLSASSCVVTSAAHCAALNGVYGGDGTTCAAPAATLLTYAGGGGAIPDAGGVGVENQAPRVSTINTTDTFTVADVEVDLAITHPSYSDLRVVLSKGDRVLVLSDRGRQNFTPADASTKALVGGGSYRFSDAGAQSWFAAGAGTGSSMPLGTYKPAAAAGISPGFVTTFNGAAAAGAWTLSITDERSNSGSPGGVLNGWSLRLRQGASAGCNPCPADLDDGSGTGVRDGGVDINDLLYFLAGYEAGEMTVDLDDGSGLGIPDGGVDINDLLFFLAHYEGGC